MPLPDLVRRAPASACLLAALLGGCASLSPSYETPTVAVTSVRVLPSEGSLPSFAIGLRVTNPNREALNLRGIAYSVSLEGNRVINGVGNDLPVIEGYGQEDVTITASPDLMAGIRVFRQLLKSSGESVNYDIDAKLDLGGLRPTLNLRESGTLDLSGRSSL